MKQKTKLTEKQVKDLVSSMQTILGAVNVAQLEYYELLPDYQKQLTQIKSRCNRILEDIGHIKRLAYTIVKPLEDVDHIDYNMGYELHRVFQFFSTMNYPQLKDYNDLIYTLPTKDIKDIKETVNQM